MIRRIIKRALSNEGQGFFRIRDEDGRISAVTVGAAVLRTVLLIAAGAAAHWLGLPLSEIISYIIGF